MFVKWGVFVADRRRFLSRVLTRDTTTLPLATPASTERSPGAPLRVEGGAPGSAIPPPCRLPPQRAQNARRGPRCASRVGHPLWGEYGAVADLVFLDAGDGGVGVLHGEAFGDGLDVVAGGDFEHLAEVAGAADVGAGDGELATDERGALNLERGRAGAEDDERALGAEGVDEVVELLVAGDGGEDEVEGAGELFDGGGFAGVDERVCAEREGFGFLVLGGGEGDDLGAEGARELDGEMAEAADADDADARGGAGAVVAERSVDGDAGAEKWGGGDAVESVRDRDDEAAVNADGRGETTVAADAGGLRLGAEMLLAGAAPFADAAGVCLPADADPLAYRGAVDVGADGGDGANDLVAGDERVAADAPVVVDEVDVGVADTAVLDADLDVVRPELAGRVAEGKELRSGGVGRESLDI